MTAARLLASCLLFAAAGPLAAGQEPAEDAVPTATPVAPADDPSDADPVVSGEALRLRGRTLENRESLYRGERKLSGLDQTPEDEYRPDLGIYRRASDGPAVVDPDEHKERMLALFSGNRLTRFPEPEHLKSQARSHSGGGSEPDAGGSGSTLGYALIALLAAGAITRRLWQPQLASLMKRTPPQET